MESLYLDERVLIELYLLVALLRWIEHEVIDIVGGGTDTVYTSDALHESRGVPWRVVVDDDIGAMQVDAFCQDIGSDDDVIIVLALAVVVGIEVFFYGIS